MKFFSLILLIILAVGFIAPQLSSRTELACTKIACLEDEYCNSCSKVVFSIGILNLIKVCKATTNAEIDYNSCRYKLSTHMF